MENSESYELEVITLLYNFVGIRIFKILGFSRFFLNALSCSFKVDFPISNNPENPKILKILIPTKMYSNVIIHNSLIPQTLQFLWSERLNP